MDGGKPDLNTLDVHGLARELLGSDQVDLSPVHTEGEETHAYRVASRGHASCLRIGRSTRNFAKDHWAHEMLGDTVPVPRIWEVGEVDDERAFCLSEWMPGITMQDLAAAGVKQALPAVFDAWSNIATFDVENISGYGIFDPETHVAPHETWHELLRAPAENAAFWDSSWTAPRSGQLAELLDTYNTLVDRCPEERGLVHGDWGSNNLLVADGRVTAVLDWEDAAIGDPLQDVAERFWATWPPVSTCVRLQAAYCEALFGDESGYPDRVLCYDLNRGLRGIGGALTDGDHTWADWAFRRCLELVWQGR